MTEVDPYDYPFPCKTQTMYLQTINQRDTGFQKIKIINPDSFALKTNDISGIFFFYEIMKIKYLMYFY